MTRQELIAERLATLRASVAGGEEDHADIAFKRVVYAALATPGCEAQGVRLVDLPHLAERVAEMADSHERVMWERNALRARIAYFEAGLSALVRHNAGTGACLPDCITNTDDGEDCNCGYMAAEDPGGFAADLLSGVAEVISERGAHEGAATPK